MKELIGQRCTVVWTDATYIGFRPPWLTVHAIRWPMLKVSQWGQTHWVHVDAIVGISGKGRDPNFITRSDRILNALSFLRNGGRPRR